MPDVSRLSDCDVGSIVKLLPLILDKVAGFKTTLYATLAPEFTFISPRLTLELLEEALLFRMSKFVTAEEETLTDSIISAET